MPFDAKLSITGIQEAQARNLRAIAALRPEGAFGMAIQTATLSAHRYAVALTHVDTGSLRASHRVDVNGLSGRVFIGPETNPRTGQQTTEYGPVEHQRGGSHAFYQRTVDEYGPGIRRDAIQIIKVGLR